MLCVASVLITHTTSTLREKLPVEERGDLHLYIGTTFTKDLKFPSLFMPD